MPIVRDLPAVYSVESTDPVLIRKTMTQNTNPLAVHGHIAYMEIPSTDLEASARFYETIFGWNVRRKSAKNVSFDDPAGNLIGRWSLDKRVSPDAGILPYIYVTIPASDQIIAHPGFPQLQGEIVKPKHTEGDIYLATFRDPSGNLLGIWQIPSP